MMTPCIELFQYHCNIHPYTCITGLRSKSALQHHSTRRNLRGRNMHTQGSCSRRYACIPSQILFQPATFSGDDWVKSIASADPCLHEARGISGGNCKEPLELIEERSLRHAWQLDAVARAIYPVSQYPVRFKLFESAH